MTNRYCCTAAPRGEQCLDQVGRQRFQRIDQQHQIGSDGFQAIGQEGAKVRAAGQAFIRQWQSFSSGIDQLLAGQVNEVGEESLLGGDTNTLQVDVNTSPTQQFGQVFFDEAQQQSFSTQSWTQ